MKKFASLLLIALAASTGLFAPASLGQSTQYVSDEQFIPLRSGPSNQHRIVHRGIPSGTRLTVHETSENGEYARVTTDRGTEGWLRSQYLMKEVPARQQLAALKKSKASLEQQLATIKSARGDIQAQLDTTAATLAAREEMLEETGSELTEIKRLSSNAINLDRNNRQLVEEAQVLNSRIEVLEADNQRLLDSAESEAFINGALAVLLGVIIALVVPRLWPRRKTSSSWA